MNRGVESRAVNSLAGYQPEIGAMLWMLEDGRRRLKEALADLDAAGEGAILGWRPRPDVSSISTLLYHVAAIEADWLFEEVLADYTPPTAVAWPDALFPYHIRDQAGHLTPMTGGTLAGHWQRLDAVRAILLEAFKGMTLAEFRRPRRLARYHVTPEWVLHHLIQHEAEHRGQMAERRGEAERGLGQA